MGHLDKHNSFWEQSQLIISNSGYFESYIHCSYYSIIQLIFSLLVEEKHYDNSDDILKDYYASLSVYKSKYPEYNDKIGYHVFLGIVLTEKINTFQTQEKKNIKFLLQKIRTYRKIADYKSINLESKRRKKCKQHFNELKLILEKKCQ